MGEITCRAHIHTQEDKKMLNILKTVEDGTLCFALEGRLDTTTAPKLEETLKSELDSADRLMLDFAKLEYISSAGLRLLLATQKRMNGQGEMVIKNVSKGIMEILEITGFNGILTFE